MFLDCLFSIFETAYQNKKLPDLQTVKAAIHDWDVKHPPPKLSVPLKASTSAAAGKAFTSAVGPKASTSVAANHSKLSGIIQRPRSEEYEEENDDDENEKEYHEDDVVDVKGKGKAKAKVDFVKVKKESREHKPLSVKFGPPSRSRSSSRIKSKQFISDDEDEDSNEDPIVECPRCPLSDLYQTAAESPCAGCERRNIECRVYTQNNRRVCHNCYHGKIQCTLVPDHLAPPRHPAPIHTPLGQAQQYVRSKVSRSRSRSAAPKARSAAPTPKASSARPSMARATPAPQLRRSHRQRLSVAPGIAGEYHEGVLTDSRLN